MEENTQPHMETNVSTTTEDVHETQKMTGSNGNVEMIIVVEKMDEESDANDESKKQLTQVDNNASTTVEEPLQTGKEKHQSPVKSLDKDTIVKNPSNKPVVEEMVVETESQPDSEVLPIVTQQVVKDVSFINEPALTTAADNQAQAQKSPKTDLPKYALKLPVKEVEMKEVAKSSPTKEILPVEKIQVNGKVSCNDTNKIDDIKSKTVINPIPIDLETSNDSQNDSISDVSEKEHKGISRELKSLIKSAKESKIISECTQLTSKTRKSRTALDTSSSSLNSSLMEPNKIQEARRNSDNSQKSNCSEKCDKITLKRSMRSQNPEFVSKVKQFLNSVTGRGNKDHDDYLLDNVHEEKVKYKNESIEPNRGSPPKIKKTDSIFGDKSNKLRLDSYCWRCHWVAEQATNDKVHPPMQCTVCPRSFHFKCLSGTERNKITPEKSWVCPECMIVLQAESSESRSPAMKKISLGMLCDLLKHALERMMDLNGVEPFMHPVDRTAFPDYDKYVVHPMDLSLMKDNITEGLYGSTEAFVADAQWILHNSIIFNTLQSKLTAGARALVRSCRAEMGEIEACPECYAAAHAHRPTWFTDVCTTPHILLWAKLKGFPYWPAKGMSVNGSGLVDVRFFGAHDRAWVPAKDCFLYSERDPNNFRTKRQDIIDSMQEAEQHIGNISRKFNKFIYPPFKTQFEPSKLHEQLKMMIPSFEGEVRSLVKEKSSPGVAKEKSRSNSKSSKSSFNDGDISETEEPTAARKMADGAEIAKIEEDDSIIEKEGMEVDIPRSKGKEENVLSNSSSRKRRRSDLEETIITIIETSGNNSKVFTEKRKRVEEDKKENIKLPESELCSKEVEEIFEVVEIPKKESTEECTPKLESVDNKGSEPSDAEKEKKQRVTPIRIAIVTKDKRHTTRRSSSSKEPIAKIITPSKDKDSEKTTPVRPKSTRTEKNEKASSSKTEKAERPLTAKIEKVDRSSKDDKDKSSKEDRTTSERRRNSRSNRSLNSSSTRSSDKIEKKTDKMTDSHSNNDKTKDNTTSEEKDGELDKSRMEKQMSPKLITGVLSPRCVKDRLQFDDDTTLAVIAREAGKSIETENNTCLPTITCVRSLSTTAQNTGTTITKTTNNVKMVDIGLEANSDSSIYTPTSTDVKITKEAVNTLQRLRNDQEHGQPVGRVGVRAFARMTSPDKQINDNMQVEIKAEPIEIDDADRHSEKMDLMNAFRLRPVNPPNPSTNLREVRINFNKVVVTSMNSSRKAVAKPIEVRPRAKKTFPQPKKADDGRSELNSKNSMVYIPIQPPMTQAPVRLPRPMQGANPAPRSQASVSTAANNLVNTVTTPLMQAKISSPPTTVVVTTTSNVASVSSVASVPSVPTVHTVPLMTSVNGQWMFSFQPVMSVGAIENAPSPPILNGLAERGTPLLTLSPAGSAPSPAPPPPGPTLPCPTLPGPAQSGQAQPGPAQPGPAQPGPAQLGPAQPGPAPALLTPVTPAPLPCPALLRPLSDCNTLGEPPRLQQRPSAVLLNPLDATTPIGSMPPPSSAGPLTAKLNQNAVKLTDFFRTLLEDSLEKCEEPAAQLTTLKLQLEQARWQHQQELDEVKHNHELTLAEMRASFEKERLRVVSEARRTSQAELEAAVRLAKCKQWCVNCSQEAQFYCCWNTSYCDLPCQRAHWSQHFAVCQQRSQDSRNGEPPSSPENRLQPQPNMPKSSCAPTLTVGGKVAPSRVSTQDRHSTQKASIIGAPLSIPVSMVEDTSGNQTMKCVGTYKPPSPAQLAPIIINKQIMTNEENANKKVVSSSGGYLIVGAGNNPSVMTPARRTHTIQYYT